MDRGVGGDGSGPLDSGISSTDHVDCDTVGAAGTIGD